MDRGRAARQSQNLTILLTTHYLEEADRLAERVAIVSKGKVVVEGTPEALKRDLRGESVSVESRSKRARPEAEEIVAGIGREVKLEGQVVRARVPNGAQAIPVILGALDDAGIAVASVTTARPSLDDVYLHYTGRAFATEDEGGLMQTIRQTGWMVVRQLRNISRQPIWVVMMIIQPMIWLDPLRPTLKHAPTCRETPRQLGRISSFSRPGSSA